MIAGITSGLIQKIDPEIYIFLRGHVCRDAHGSKWRHYLCPLRSIDGTDPKIAPVNTGQPRIQPHGVGIILRKVWIGLRNTQQRDSGSQQYGYYLFQSY